MAKTSKAATPTKKPGKSTGQEEVNQFMNQVKHPLKEAMVELRGIILGAHKGVTEHIKWKGPSFCIDDDDRVTFNLHKDDCIMIVFHRGAKVKDSKTKGPLFKDTTGLLEWITDDRAMVKLHSTNDVREKAAGLKKVTNQWIKLTRA